MFQIIGRYFVIFGLLLIIIGTILFLAGRIPWLGKLPGDILLKRGNFTFYFPVTTCILASIVLSLLFYLFFKR